VCVCVCVFVFVCVCVFVFVCVCTFVDLHKEAIYTKGRVGGQTTPTFPDPKHQPRSDDGWAKRQWQVQCVAGAPRGPRSV
jgi:hypothetical protein